MSDSSNCNALVLKHTVTLGVTQLFEEQSTKVWGQEIDCHYYCYGWIAIIIIIGGLPLSFLWVDCHYHCYGWIAIIIVMGGLPLLLWMDCHYHYYGWIAIV